MIEHPLVTIAIPTFNRGNGYLRQTLQCAAAQDYPNLEILVSDNCSEDNTAEVVREIRHPGIRYVRQERNIGATENFTFCVENARGRFLLLLHDDDVVDPDFISTCMAAARDAPDVGVIRAGTRIIDRDGRTIREYPNRTEGLSNGEFFLQWLGGQTALYLCSTLYNTRRLREVGGFGSKTNLYNDDAALFRLTTLFGRADVEAVKAGFRKHEGNRGSTVRIREWCEDSLYLLDLMCRLEPDYEAEILDRGRLFFTKRNYEKAQGIASPFERLKAYSLVYATFSRCYSPLRFMAHRGRERMRRILYRLGGFGARPRRAAEQPAEVAIYDAGDGTAITGAKSEYR